MGVCPIILRVVVARLKIALFSRMTDVTAHPIEPVRVPASESRLHAIWRNTFPFIVVFGLWEIVARAGIFPPKLFPSLVTVAHAFVNLTMRGILPHHVLD